jgi:hypothetical protein
VHFLPEHSDLAGRCDDGMVDDEYTRYTTEAGTVLTIDVLQHYYSNTIICTVAIIMHTCIVDLYRLL